MVLSRLPFSFLLLLPLSSRPCSSLSDRPFVVVWNVPTERCHKLYDVHLDLGAFDIVENRQQKFQGQNVTIFYRDHLGKYPHLSRDGRKVNGGVPQLGDLAAHLSLALKQISSLLQSNFTGIGVIDWEEWRPLWETNFGSKSEYRRLSELLVRQESPGMSDSAVKSVARQRFEDSARRFMEETLRWAVRERPKGFWGFYGFPVCFNKQKRKTDKTFTGRCSRGTEQRSERLSWLWAQSTALYPSIYLPQRLAGATDAALMVRHRLLEALRVASRWRHSSTDPPTPVFPYARVTFAHTLNFLNETDLLHTLGESASLGAAGVVLWGELKFAKSKNQCILLRNYLHEVLGPFIRSLRSHTQRCSFQLCHGNGRCARRHPSSGHMVSSGQAVTSHLFTSSSGVGSVRNHFVCRCYPGWTGPECQQKVEDEEDRAK